MGNEDRKGIFEKNVLIDIDEFMDVQFGKPGTPERERFREEARLYMGIRKRIGFGMLKENPGKNEDDHSSCPDKLRSVVSQNNWIGRF